MAGMPPGAMDDLLARIRSEWREWLAAVPASPAERRAAKGCYVGFETLDTLLASGAPLPSAWASARIGGWVAAGAHFAQVAERDAEIARLQAELGALSPHPVEYVTTSGLEAAKAAGPDREDGSVLRLTDGARRAFTWRAAGKAWEPLS